MMSFSTTHSQQSRKIRPSSRDETHYLPSLFLRMRRLSQRTTRNEQLHVLLLLCITSVLLTFAIFFHVAPPLSSNDSAAETDKLLGAIVFLAPQRRKESFGTTRFCLLMRAVRTIDQYITPHYGPYPVYILVAKDHRLDPHGLDGPYTEEDRALIRSWAPNTTVVFEEINMYSEDALEPGTTRETIMKWIRENPERSMKSLGYRSMCRLWSGRLQKFDWMQRYQYYLRMDDDSMLVAKPDHDPFLYMQEKGLLYYYRLPALDEHGKDELYRIALPHLIRQANLTGRTLSDNYIGVQPYNNFHISSTQFWNSPEWTALFDELDRNNIFFRHSVGDANVHYMATLMMPFNEVVIDYDFPYRHNTNDMGDQFVTQELFHECMVAGVGQV